MENNKSSFFSPQFVLGIMIIAVGVVFMLDNLYIIDAGEILRYWPVILIVYGAVKGLQSRNSSGQIFGWSVAAIGLLLLLDRMNFIDFRLWDWWPIILIVIGLNFLRGTWGRSRIVNYHSFKEVPNDTDAYIKNTAMLSGVKRVISSKEFLGGELTAMMGGCEIDLRDAEMKGSEAVIDVNVVMGGIEMRVPLGWSVVLEATPIMGGVDDTTYPSKQGTTKRLIITGSIFMGGVEIKN